jgi:hypothetical protein
MRQRVDAALDRMAELIKDALLDGVDLGEPDDEPPPPDLPPLAADEFVARMRGPVEEALRQVAEAVNAAPAGAALAAAEEETADLFTELWWTALRTGLRMRLDAAAAEPPGEPPPQGEWARRYRSMVRAAESPR